MRVPIVKNLEEASRLPVRVEEQRAQQLAMNPPRSAGEMREEGETLVCMRETLVCMRKTASDVMFICEEGDVMFTAIIAGD